MSTFRFKYFSVEQADYAHAVGTDAMILGSVIDYDSPSHILDIGTGTGVLALMMGQRFPKTNIKGVEKNLKASELAQKNFDQSPFKDRLDVISSTFQEYASSSEDRYDLILSNPPFFKSSTSAKGSERNMARHQSSLSIEDLIEGVQGLLKENGAFWLILPPDQARKFINISTSLYLRKRIEIFGKPGKHVRDILQFTRKPASGVVEEKIVIRDEDGQYSPRYKAMTKEFHGVEL